MLSFKTIDYKGLLVCVIARFLYTYLTVTILDGLWYSGSGGYGIDYVFSKDLIEYCFFIFELMLVFGISRSDSFKDIVLNTLLLIYMVPLNASGAINNMSYEYIIFTNVFLLLIIISLSIQRSDGKIVSNFNLFDELTRPIFIYIFFILSLFFIAYKISYNGFQINFSLLNDDVYANRADRSDYMLEISGSLYAYVLVCFQGLMTFINPIYLYLSLHRKSVLGIIVSSLALLSEFSLASSKTVLIFSAVILFVYYCERRKKKIDFQKSFRMIVLFIFCICLVESMFSETGLLYMFIVRRTFYAPAWLNTMYYDFFSANPKVYWSQNVMLLQNIIPNVYDSSPLDLISRRFFNGYMASPNTGMFAEAYMHWGWGGIVVYPILYYVIFSFASSVYTKCGKSVSSIIAIDVVLRISNAPITRTDVVLSFGFFTFLIWILLKFKANESSPSGLPASSSPPPKLEGVSTNTCVFLEQEKKDSTW